jgi:hypothetical protein
MFTWSGTARRRRARGRSARLVVPAVVTLAVGLAVGVMVAAMGKPSTWISDSAHRTHAVATPLPTAANMDCGLIVPANPLSAAGLATPWQLTGPDGTNTGGFNCTQSTLNLQAFVQATILDPATGRLWVYEPLVVTQGSAPAVAPARPHLPRHAIVNVMVGFNGNNLYLIGAGPQTLARANCVNGLNGSVFGQVSYCNSAAFYAAAYRDIARGTLRIRGNGRSPVTGQACPTTRSFDLVDQDPSDNVTTKYLLTADGRTAQDNAANLAALPGAITINNGSDNALLDNFILPSLGCTPFTAPDLSGDGRPGTSQTLDELSAAVNQKAPVALVPENDPMTMTGNGMSADKTNLYRIGVGQPPLPADQAAGGPAMAGDGQTADAPAAYCANMLNVQTPFIAANQARFAGVVSPVPLTGSNLFTFMAARLSASYGNLGCAGFNLQNTVNLTTGAQGAAIAATLTSRQQQPGVAPAAAAAAAPAAPATDPTTDPAAPGNPGNPGTPAAPSDPASQPSPGPSQPWTPSTPWAPGAGGGGGTGYNYGN